MASITSSEFSLTGNNKLWIVLSWNENISGSQNKVDFTMTVKTKWRINGVWKCRLRIDGEDFGAPLCTIRHGAGSSTNVRTVSKTFNYTGSKSISVFAAIENMDYYDVSMGPSSSAIHYPNLSSSINLRTNNRPPNTPSISCSNSYENGKYLAEGTLDVALSNVSDPDGDTVNYRIYGECKKPGMGWESMGTISTSRTVSHRITGYPRGTQFKVWGHALDSHGVSSGTSNTIENIYRNQTPNAVTSISPGTSYFNENSFTISWSNPGDPDGTIPKFDLYMSKNNGAYTSVFNYSSNTSHTQNIASDPEGTKYQFRVCSSDGQTTSAFTYSAPYYKNSKPTIPKYIFPSGGYYLGNVNITWNASTDPEQRGISHYNVYINDSYVGRTSTTSFTWRIPDNDAYDKSYLVSVEAVDIDGKTSDKGSASSAFKKASPPQKPTNLKPVSTYHEDSIDLSWDTVASNGTNVYYEVDYRVNNGSWISLTTTIKTARYSHNITSISRGSKIEYRIRCRNTFDQYSDYAYSSIYYRNMIPLQPSIVYPISNATVFDKSPRIAISIYNEPDGQSQIVYVKCNDVVYNSSSHKSMFSRNTGTFSGATKIVFECPELKLGENIIEVYTSDGLINSPHTKRTINIASLNADIKTGAIITVSAITRARECINSIRTAYGLTTYTFQERVSASSYIKYNHLVELRTSIEAARNAINNFDVNNINKKPVNWTTSSTGSIIFGSLFEEVTSMIQDT